MDYPDWPRIKPGRVISPAAGFPDQTAEDIRIYNLVKQFNCSEDRVEFFRSALITSIEDKAAAHSFIGDDKSGPWSAAYYAAVAFHFGVPSQRIITLAAFLLG